MVAPLDLVKGVDEYRVVEVAVGYIVIDLCHALSSVGAAVPWLEWIKGYSGEDME